MKKNKAVFLDRDGTIIRDKNYLSSPEDTELYSGVTEALKLLKSAGFLLIVCTNQSGMARGLFSEEDYYAVEKRLGKLLAAHGVVIDKTYCCPHLPDGTVKRYAVKCRCRKPEKGMFLAAQKEFNIDFKSSYAIGDSPRDLIPAKELGAATILVLTGKGKRLKELTDSKNSVDYVCRNLYYAAKKIINILG
ncbi:MAG: HAD-IIIA family hydrolase [Planctomycetota bacterium]